MNGDNQQQPDQTEDQAQSPWQYRPAVSAPQEGYDQGQDSAFDAQYAAQPEQSFTWTASEFIAHEKDGRWYALFGLALLAVAVIVYFVSRDIFSVGIILGVAGLVAYTAGRKPQVVTFKVDGRGVTIGDKFRPYADFHSFDIVKEGAFSSIMLAPLKRFGVAISLYYEPKDEEAIIGVIAQHLPIEHREHDSVDRLSRRIRF